MKELLKKVFSKKISTPVFVGFGVFAIFTFIVFPGLSVDNVFLNIITTLIALFTLVFLFYYINGDKMYDTFMSIEPGETEIDYVNPEELKPKKRTVKKIKVK